MAPRPQQEPGQPDVYLIPIEAATYLRVAVTTLTKWRAQRKGPLYRTVAGNLIRYVQSELEQWMTTQAVLPGDVTMEDSPLPPPTTPHAAVYTLPPRRRAARAPHKRTSHEDTKKPHTPETSVQTSPLPGETSTALPPPFPRPPLELLVLETLAAMAPMPVTPRQMTEILQQPHQAVSATLRALATLGTIQHLRAGYSSHGPGTPNQPPLKQRGGSRPPPPWEDPPPSTRSAAEIARIVAQEHAHAGDAL